METKDKVLQTLKDSATPLKPGDIAEKTGIDRKDVDKAIKALKTEGRIESPKMCFYCAK